LQVKLLRQADRSLELLEGDEAKYADEMTQQQEAFVSTINNLAAVSHDACSDSVQCLGSLRAALHVRWCQHVTLFGLLPSCCTTHTYSLLHLASVSKQTWTK
jgi:hypothetical protein